MDVARCISPKMARLLFSISCFNLRKKIISVGKPPMRPLAYSSPRAACAWRMEFLLPKRLSSILSQAAVFFWAKETCVFEGLRQKPGLDEEEIALWASDLVSTKISRRYQEDKELALVMDWMSGTDQDAFKQMEEVHKQMVSAAVTPREERKETESFSKRYHTPAKYKVTRLKCKRKECFLCRILHLNLWTFPMQNIYPHCAHVRQCCLEAVFSLRRMCGWWWYPSPRNTAKLWTKTMRKTWMRTRPDQTRDSTWCKARSRESFSIVGSHAGL